MKRKMLVIILTMCICLIICVPSVVFAADSSQLNEIYNVGNGGFGDATFQNKVGNILGLIQVIGYVTAIVMAVVIGIKFIMSSPEGKADVKKTLTPYVIGCLILTMGTAVVSIVAAFAHNSVVFNG